MRLHFRAAVELQPNDATKRRFQRLWPAYRDWFLEQGAGARPRYLSCERALREHVPELVPLWEQLCELAGGGDHEARMLSLYRPSPYLHGCSQAVWTRDGQPLLARNYDYHPSQCEGTILLSRWNGTRTIVQSDCLWGVLDGMNEHGLAVSLAFGGTNAAGDGFGIPLVLRYILEHCRNTGEAERVLRRVPSHMAYNVLVLDAKGVYANVYVAPGQKAVFTRNPAATNHQDSSLVSAHAAATFSVERERYLLDRCVDPKESRGQFVDRFLQPPLFNRRWDAGFGTLYTASYDPKELAVEYRWRNHTWRLRFDDFDESELIVRYK